MPLPKQTCKSLRRWRYPEQRAIRIWKKKGIIYSVVRNNVLSDKEKAALSKVVLSESSRRSLFNDFYCGYARFPQRPVAHKHMVTTMPAKKDRLTPKEIEMSTDTGMPGFVNVPIKHPYEASYYGILTWVPVHGGITYAVQSKEDGTMVYGFDCHHAGDEDNLKVKNIDWVAAECERMATAIKVAAKYESSFERYKENEQKISIIGSHFHKELEERFGIKFDLTDNFGAMLSVLSGKV